MTTITTSPAEILHQAQEAIEAGHLQHGAGLAYAAAWNAISQKAANHGQTLVNDDDAITFAQWLDANNPAQPIVYDRNGQDIGRKMVVTGSYIVALAFKDHADLYPQQQRHDGLYYWSLTDYRRYLPQVGELVQSVSLICPQDNN